jgi:hypothetical protein
MKSFKELAEVRANPSAATKAKMQKPLTRGTAAALKVKMSNIIGDLDSIANKLSNEITLDKSKSGLFPTVKKIDMMVKDAKVLQKELKKLLKV